MMMMMVGEDRIGYMRIVIELMTIERKGERLHEHIRMN